MSIDRSLWRILGRGATSICFVGFLATVSVAPAATTSTTFKVTSTVPDECAVSVSDLAFGNYSVPAGTAVDGSTPLIVTCSGGTSYEIALNAGTGSGASIAIRKMTSGSNTLNYTLYRDAPRTQLWGQTAAADTVSGTGTGSVQSISIFGRIVASQAAAAGSYIDTITVTVTF
jgi:spore coat protein U-like protein